MHAKIVTNLLFDFEAKLFRNDYKIYEKRKYKIRQILFKAKLKKKKNSNYTDSDFCILSPNYIRTTHVNSVEYLKLFKKKAKDGTYVMCINGNVLSIEKTGEDRFKYLVSPLHM